MGCVASSTLQRACESAQLLAAGRPLFCDPLFVETEIPSRISLRLALAPRYWSVLARAAWFCGWSRGVESLREARDRAHHAADRLDELAREHGSVMLVGHGMMNRLISRALRRSGWRGSAPGVAYWSVGALERAA
jgi:broad specificity phosphatase PhoE